MICLKCGHQYSDKEKICPKCGMPSPQQKKIHRGNSSKKKVPTPLIIAAILALCLLVGSLFFYITHSHKQEPKQQGPNDVATEKEVKKAEKSSPKEDNSKDNTYAYPSIDKQVLSKEILDGMSPSELKLAENEILARHGRIFTEEDFKTYFENKAWYKPSLDAKDFDAKIDSLLNDVEKENLKNIRQRLESVPPSPAPSSSKNTFSPTEEKVIEAVKKTNSYASLVKDTVNKNPNAQFSVSPDTVNNIKGHTVDISLNLQDHVERLETYFVGDNQKVYLYNVINNSYDLVD